MAENRSAKKPDSLSGFKLFCRNVESNEENKGAGGREDTISQQISSPEFFQRLQEAKTWDYFSIGRYTWRCVVLDGHQVVGAHEVGEGFCSSATREDATCPSFLIPM